jgi:hypothetical protein
LAADVKAEALWDGRKIVPFKAIDNPPMVGATAASKFLGDEEYVLGVTINGKSRAYPTRFAWWHHIINDRIDDTPYAVTYCSVCNTGIRFDPRVDGETLLLDFYGLYNGVTIYCDRDTESVWLQVSGKAVKGPRVNKQMAKRPLLDTTWGEWKKLHPDTMVMSPETPFKEFYRPKGVAEKRGYDTLPTPFHEGSMTRIDQRLPPFVKVLGVAVPTQADPKTKKESLARRAYPIPGLTKAGGVVNDAVGGKPVAIFMNPTSITATAVSRQVDGRTLTFVARKISDGTVQFFDKETHTRWSIEGRGEAGPLAGKSLETVENHLSQWYGWAAYFPDTTIYGRTDPPQPTKPYATALPHVHRSG